MALNFKSFFGERKSTTGSAAQSDLAKPHLRERFALYASEELRETLSGIKKIEFIRYGRLDDDIFPALSDGQIKGALIHSELDAEKILAWLAIAEQKFPQVPFLILCAQNNQAECSQYGWRTVAVRDWTDAGDIEEQLERTRFLFPAMKRETLRQTLTALKTIPTEAASHQKILQELQHSEFSLEKVTELIKKDPALTVQLLKIVNSAAFSRGTAVQSVEEAVAILGVSKLRALIASAWAFFLIDDHACAGFHPKNEWAHAAKIAEGVKNICQTEAASAQTTETALIAAMLHDLGKLLLAANLPRDYAFILAQVKKEQRPIWEVEEQLLGFNHAEIAGCLLGIWGVPRAVAEAVMRHHAADVATGTPEWMIQQAHTQS